MVTPVPRVPGPVLRSSWRGVSASPVSSIRLARLASPLSSIRLKNKLRINFATSQLKKNCGEKSLNQRKQHVNPVVSPPETAAYFFGFAVLALRQPRGDHTTTTGGP